ncbi:hypothetical protein D3C75_399470 [compost metagenome]
MPSLSSCSGLLIPRRSADFASTSPIDTNSPHSVIIITISALRGFMGVGCVTAWSIIRTLPMALEREMFNSCWRVRSCRYTARPESTSRLRRTIACCVDGIALTRLSSLSRSPSKIRRFSRSARYVGWSFLKCCEISASRKVSSFN